MSYKDQYIPTRDGRIAVRDYGGSGPDMLLIHGNGANLIAWETATPFLTPRRRVIGMDIRNRGLSDPASGIETADLLASDVRAVVDALSLQTPLIVGHSYGGQIAEHYASRGNPYRGLVLVDVMFKVMTRAGREQDYDIEDWASNARKDGDFEWPVSEFPKRLKQLMEAFPSFNKELAIQYMLRDGNVVDGVYYRKPSINSIIKASGGKDYLKNFWPDERDGYADFYSRIKEPVLTVWGALGIAKIADCADKVRRLPEMLPNVRVVWIDGADHNVAQAAPAAFSKVLLAFDDELIAKF